MNIEDVTPELALAVYKRTGITPDWGEMYVPKRNCGCLLGVLYLDKHPQATDIWLDNANVCAELFPDEPNAISLAYGFDDGFQRIDEYLHEVSSLHKQGHAIGVAIRQAVEQGVLPNPHNLEPDGQTGYKISSELPNG